MQSLYIFNMKVPMGALIVVKVIQKIFFVESLIMNLEKEITLHNSLINILQFVYNNFYH